MRSVTKNSLLGLLLPKSLFQDSTSRSKKFASPKEKENIFFSASIKIWTENRKDLSKASHSSRDGEKKKENEFKAKEKKKNRSTSRARL